MSEDHPTVPPALWVSNDTAWVVDDEGVILLHLPRGEYRRLGGSGSAVWQVLDELHEVSEVVLALSEAYGLDVAAIEGEVAPLLAQLLADGYLVDAEPPPQEPFDPDREAAGA